MGRKVEILLLLAVIGVSLRLPGASAVDSRDYEEAQKEDEQVDANNARESSTEYPNGVNVIPGNADIHYPIYSKIEKSSFACAGRLPGFYADTELRCQVWHICDESGVQQSFLCTNGTIYSQDKRVCDWWYNVNCDPEEVSRNYEQNAELYKGPPPKDGQTKAYAETNDLPPPPPRKPASHPPQHKPQQQSYQPQSEQARPQSHQRQQQHERPQELQERPQQRPNYEQQQQQHQTHQRQHQPQPQPTQQRPQPHPQRPTHEQQQYQHQEPQAQRPRPQQQQQQQNYEAPTPRRQPSSAPQQNTNHQAPSQSPASPRPAGSPAPAGGPEKKRVIVLRLPGPLPPGATIPPHLLMEYAETVLAAERAGKPPPPGLVSSETVTLRPTTTTPPPVQQQGRVRPTPRGPIVPYTPRSFAAFLEDASRLNGQTKTKPAPAPPKPSTTTPPPAPQRAPTGQYQEAPRRPQPQPQQQYQQAQRTQPPPPPPTQPRRYEEPQQSRSTPPPQQRRYEEPQQSRPAPPPQQRRYEEPRSSPPTYESQPASYNQDASSNEQQQAKQEEQRRPAPPPPAPQQKKPVPPPKPVKSHPPPPHSDGKKFRHSTPRKHGEVRFAPKSALAVEDLEEFTEESRRPAYFNNLQHVPYLSPDVSTTSTTNSPKASVHLKTSFENFEKVRPQRVKQQLKTAFEDSPIPSTSERYLAPEEIVEPAIKRLVVAAGLKIKDPRGRPTTTASPVNAGSSEEVDQSYRDKDYEPVRVIVTRKQAPSPPTTPETPAAASVEETTPKVVMRRVIRKKIRKNSNSTSPPVQVAEQAFTRVYHHSARQPSLIPVREDPVPQQSPTTVATRKPTTTSRTTTTTTTPVPYNDGEQEYFEPEYKPFKNYGFDVYGRTEDEEEEELVRAAQEYYQASEYYGRKQRNA